MERRLKSSPRTVRALFVLTYTVFNPQNPVSTLRNMTSMNNPQLVDALIDKIDILVDGGQLIQV
jgi:hypothetical protein